VWLDLGVCGWSLLSAPLVAWGVQCRSAGFRTVMMGLCALLVAGEPMVLGAVAYWGDAGALWTMRVSPLETVWALAQPITSVHLDPWPELVLTAVAAAVAAWAVLGVTVGLMSARGGGREG